jgi:hypothetical protein
MFQSRRSVYAAALFGSFLFCAGHALAQQVNTASATMTCNAYSLSVSASGLDPATNYQIDYQIDPLPSSGGSAITGSIPFNTGKSDVFDGTVTGSFPTLNGSFSFSGTATLAGSTTSIDFSPTNLTCNTAPPLSDDGCIYTLGRSGQGISITGSANLSAPGCSIFDNSASGDAATITGSAKVVAKSISIVGGYRGMPNSFSPTPTMGATPISDPLDYIPEPTIPANCAANPHFAGSSAHVLSPGCYNGLSLSGSGNLTLEPGLYIINGSLNFDGSRTVSGTGVTFYTTGTTRISGSRVLVLSAPTSGTYNGLLFFQSRSDYKAMSFSGSTGSDVQGIIYAPKADLTYTGSTGATFHTDVVVDSVTITGSATIHSYGSSQ